MARLHHVKKARKARPDQSIEVGDSYYWWANKTGPYSSTKRYSKTRPRPSQMTVSEFSGQQLALGERLEDLSINLSFEDLVTIRDEIVDEIGTLGEEQTEKHDNMPEGLQAGPTGELLENRGDECDSWANELEGVDIPNEEDVIAEVADDLNLEDYDDENLPDEMVEAIEEKKQSVIEELQGCEYQGE